MKSDITVFVKKEQIYYLYLYENKVNGKVYVGQTDNLRRRDRHHVNQPDASMAIDNAIKKYGRTNFDLTIILIEDTLDKINQEEIYWISRMRKFLGNDNVYNIANGARQPLLEETKLKISQSMKNHVRTDEHKQNISKSKMGENNPMFNVSHSEEHKTKIAAAMIGSSNHFYGKTHSEETKNKMSILAKGRKFSKETRNKLSNAHKGKTWKLIDGKRVWSSK